jgi:hypothetical protein
LELELPDEATTMILNTKGTHGDISKDIKSFYDYVNNHIVTTDFTKQIDDEISYLKLDTKVRREFMLMEARLLDERREGEAVGIAKGKEIGLVEGEAIGLAKEKLATANVFSAWAFLCRISPRLLLSRLSKSKRCKLSKLDTKVRREFMFMEARLLDERREGVAKGEANANIATAKRMLDKGCYSPEVIAELTNLSLADVEKLKKEV